MINSVIILGGGSSSYYICRNLRNLGFEKPITIITEESILPYNRVLLPRILRGEIELTKVFFADSTWYKQNNITVYGGIVAQTSRDNQNNPRGLTFSKASQSSSQRLDDSIELEPYRILFQDEKKLNLEVLINKPNTALIVATGGDAYMPTEYAGINSVYTWRTLKDTLDIGYILNKNTGRLGIVGGSFIGMELALAAQHYNVDFDWIIQTKTFLRDGLDQNIQEKLLNCWAKGGNKVPLFDSSILSLSNLTNGLVKGYINGIEEKIYDHIILGTGITPSLALKKHALKQNDIYYAGDMVEIEYRGIRVQTGSFNQIVKTSRYITQDIIGELDILSDLVTISQDLVQTPYQIKFKDTTIRLIGLFTLPECSTKTIFGDKDRISQFWYAPDNDQIGSFVV